MTPGPPWHRERIVWLVVAIPIVAIVSGIAMLVIALNSDDGLVTDDYYRRGNEINRELRRDRAALRRGIHALLSVEDKTIVLDLAGGAAPSQLQLQLLHVTRAGHDKALLLPRGADGRYRGALFDLAPGRYYVQLAAEDWRVVGAMRYPADGRVRLEAALSRDDAQMPRGPARQETIGR